MKLKLRINGYSRGRRRTTASRTRCLVSFLALFVALFFLSIHWLFPTVLVLPRGSTLVFSSEWAALAPTRSTVDQDCPFRNSPIYRSVYVYPSPGEVEWQGDILSEYGRTNNIQFPWVANDRQARQGGYGPYDIYDNIIQYNTELLVREIIHNPRSCLRTDDPEKATLFYVPYLPSAEFHNGTDFGKNYDTSPHAEAILSILDKRDYDPWERVFGLTSKYWKRRHGADHILVMSEPLHGFSHPRSKRGNYHFVHSQKQLTPPIVISVELSTTFVRMFPNCARKNILVPYPNTNGMWFNGKLASDAAKYARERLFDNLETSPAALPAEKELAKQNHSARFHHPGPRTISYFCRNGNHGTCADLRRKLKWDYFETDTGRLVEQTRLNYPNGYYHSTFCICPGGDSPSAKRMFDVMLAGCIPVVLSEDYVWPYSEEFDTLAAGPNVTETKKWLHPADFSLRLGTDDFLAKYEAAAAMVERGELKEPRVMQSFLESLSAAEILRLRKGVQGAAERYGYYQRRPDLPDNPLREGVLPDGGAAHALVQALSERAAGALWPACERELKTAPKVEEPKKFLC